ncbi:MAG: 2-succinyl-5-enolpyruvyl-6-hydroxy-3-cyclohexene-1-carboxylic-acid synthase [Corynebacterium sp.]|nr:2-succinyl-5-enolpyruvyl-6-hydroxy-3-cyclohexene-1-carboxylic-acid synthase [Corynebacterium sp.]
MTRRKEEFFAQWPELASADTAEQQPSYAVAAETLRSLIAHGVRDFVYCPGSRNAPLAWALGRFTGIRVHTRVDERSAAFLALGLGRAGQPAAVITTSGTAVANCMPAVVEAAYSHIRMVVLTADRPSYYVDTGVSQTIRQDEFFGSYAPTINVVAPALVAEVDAIHELPQWAAGGPVHINLPFAEPLVYTELSPSMEAAWGTPIPVDSISPAAAATATAVAGTTESMTSSDVPVDLSKNTLVIAGDGAWEVPGLEEVPTIAEPTAPAPFNPVHPLAAKIFHTVQVNREINDIEYVVNTKPEQVIIVGRPTLHRDVLALLGDASISLISMSQTELFTDPEERAVHARSLKVTGAPSREWLRICEGASTVAAQAVRSTLEGEFNPGTTGITGMHVAAAVADTLGDGDVLFIGSSNPIRDFSMIGLPFAGVDTYSPRGVAGIDGTISQAIGVALAAQRRNPDELRAPRTVAVVGDITFLHEAAGLLGAGESVEDLTIVIVNDNGGSIFEYLEPGTHLPRESFEQYFAMPQTVDFGALVGAYGVDFEQVTTVEDLMAALDSRIEEPRGLSVIEVVCRRDNRRELHAALDKQVTLG